ncbi:MAG TPA: RDD family protein, partial [Verrucomicrobiae bacterium]|nr:RDD family protein [Verrucomicrobiae bacterium]
MSKTNTLQIRTPEGVVFSQLLAGPLTRFVAWLVDFAAVFAVQMVILMILGMFGVLVGEFIVALQFLLLFVLN